MRQQYDIYKEGLLLVVLFCLIACSTTEQHSSSSSENSSTNTPLQYFSKKKAASKADSLSDKELQVLQPGDILLRKGFGVVSDFIADYLNEKYPITHCGLLIFQDSTWQVLHTISNDHHDGMICESLASYCQQSQEGTLIAVRLKAITQQTTQILLEAEKLLAAKIPFDMGFDDRDSSRLYCAEMIRDVYKKVLREDIINKRTTKQGIDVLSMSNFLDSTHFNVIFNHFDSTNTSSK